MYLQIEDISQFVSSVNGVLQAQEETTRLEEVAKKITGYSVMDVPSELKDVSWRKRNNEKRERERERERGNQTLYREQELKNEIEGTKNC